MLTWQIDFSTPLRYFDIMNSSNLLRGTVHPNAPKKKRILFHGKSTQRISRYEGTAWSVQRSSKHMERMLKPDKETLAKVTRCIGVTFCHNKLVWPQVCRWLPESQSWLHVQWWRCFLPGTRLQTCYSHHILVRSKLLDLWFTSSNCSFDLFL